NRIKGENQRIAERLEATTGRTGLATPVQSASSAAIDLAATTAVAAAVLPPGAIDDVLIRPIPPKPSLFAEPIVDEAAAPEPQISKQYIPPEAQPVQGRTPRMPRMEDLPVPVQNAMRKSRGDAEEPEIQERRPRGLFQRLGNRLGGRRADDSEGTDDADV